jgi:hypothetical protein
MTNTKKFHIQSIKKPLFVVSKISIIRIHFSTYIIHITNSKVNINIYTCEHENIQYALHNIYKHKYVYYLCMLYE